MLLTYRYRIKDRTAKKRLRQFAFAVNQVWNYCNAYQKDIESRYRAGSAKRKWPTHFGFCALTSGSSKELYLHSQTINGVCKQYTTSRNTAKRSLRYRASDGPRRALGWIPFEKGNCQVKDNCITYLGYKFRIFGSKRRPIPNKVGGGSFVEDAKGHWYICLRVDVPNQQTGHGQIGIDLGLKTLATCSNGDTIAAMRHYRKYEANLAIQNRARNLKRARSIHAKIANCRKDQLHKASAKIAKENILIAVGNVNAAAMKRRMRFGKSVSDAGWSMFRNMLAYKASRHQACLIVVNEAFTTQTCSECGTLPPERPKGIAGLGIRQWECSSCGASHDRDVNAARNILAIALSTQRPVEESVQNQTKIRTICTTYR